MAETSEFCFVYTTTSSLAEARKIANVVVGRRLAACANVISGMESVYWWNGAMDSATEVVVVFKTRLTLLDALTAAVVAEHSYACPCVVALPIVGGNPDYLRWLGDESCSDHDANTE